MDEPILYTFRRCPYAIRARLALKSAGVDYQHREVLLRDKPAEMLKISSKGTVPVLQTKELIIDESIDIMRWALNSHPRAAELDHTLVKQNDLEFKECLDRYKYFDRYPEYSQDFYLQSAIPFLKTLENSFQQSDNNSYYLVSAELSPLDFAILPFIRQFALVDKTRFDALGFEHLSSWLDSCLASDWFQEVMIKKPRWCA